MKLPSMHFLALLILPALIIANTTFAASNSGSEKKAGIDFGGKSGLEYDSNLSVQELDKSSNESDTASIFDLYVMGHYAPAKKVSLKTGYSYSAKFYQEYDDFDQTNHTFHVDGSYDFDALTIGTNYYHVKANLASEHFLTMNIASIYTGKMLNDHIYWRNAINTTEKSFPNSSERDADAISLNGDLFVFFNNANTLLSMGLSAEQDDAKLNIYSNDAILLRTSLSHKFSLLSKKNKAELSLRYTNKDYEGYDPIITAKRDDTRRTVKASWDIEFTRYLSLAASLEHGNYASNLATADYNETLAAILLKAKF